MGRREDLPFNKTNWFLALKVLLVVAVCSAVVIGIEALDKELEPTEEEKAAQEAENKAEDEEAEKRKANEESPAPEIEHFDSGTKRISLDMDNTDFGEVEEVDMPGNADYVTLCHHGVRVWMTGGEDGGSFATEDPECAALVKPRG